MAARKRYRSIKQPRADAERISMAVSRPGIDPRTWVSMGRTEQGDDAYWFDSKRGWIVDVQLYGGGAHATTVPCRALSQWPGLDGYGEYRPPGNDEEVLVVLPGGDPEEDPIVVGVVGNEDGSGAPTSVCGRPVIPEGTTIPMLGPIAAVDCEFVKSPYSRVVEYGGEWHQKAKWITFETGSPIAGIKLGSATAMHPVPRGDILLTIIGQLVAGITALAAAGAVPGVPLIGAPAWDLVVKSLAALTAQLQSLGVVVD